MYIVFKLVLRAVARVNFDPRGSNVYKPMSYLLKLLDRSGINYEHSTSCIPFQLEPERVRYYLGDLSGPLLSDLTEDYTANLLDSIRDSGARSVVIISHSHGSWLAMKQILEDQFEGLDILLITLDAISKKNCSPQVFLRNLFLNSTPAGPIKRECTEFPSDFSILDLKKLREDTHRWVNIYQTGYYYLHSERNLFADANLNIRIEKNILSNEHADQPYNQIVHRVVYKSMMNFFKRKELR